MKDTYLDWVSLKKDAALEKAQDISKDKGTATLSFSDGKTHTTLVYKQNELAWVKQK